MTSVINQLLAEKGMELRDFGLTFATLIANLAVDPHGYFEKKYTARIESARSEHEINSVLAQLVQWAASSSVSDDERVRLDKQLALHGLPPVNELRRALLP